MPDGDCRNTQGGGNFDNLDYRDMDCAYFYEPAFELGFAGNVTNGWLDVIFVARTSASTIYARSRHHRGRETGSS